MRTLESLFGAGDLMSVDADFRAWALIYESKPPKARAEL
jgi:hypothetical protein